MLTADETGVSPFGVPVAPMLYIWAGVRSFLVALMVAAVLPLSYTYVQLVHVCLRAPSEPCKFTYGIIIMCVLLVGRFILLTVLMCAAMMIWGAGKVRAGWWVEIVAATR